MSLNKEINKILDTFGMKGSKAAEIMGISFAVFRNRKAGTPGNHFHPENLEDLKAYIIKHAKELKASN